jgi:hypothetical protein
MDDFLFIYWDDGGESNGTFAFGAFRFLLKRLSMESRFDDGVFG